MTKGTRILIEAVVDKIEDDGTIKVTMPYHSNKCKSEQVVVGIPTSSIHYAPLNSYKETCDNE